jgi:hypothetical protein
MFLFDFFPETAVYLYVYTGVSIFYIYLQKTKLKENGNFCLFAAHGKWKRKTLICLLQTETENGSLFSLVAKDKR